MRRIYLSLGTLLLVAALALLGYAVAEHKGYVLFAYKGFRYESSLWVFIVVVAAVWLALYLLRLLSRLLLTSGALVNPWSRRHHERRARQASEKGFVELAEGRWERALRHLRRAAENDSRPLVHYLGAARAANHLALDEERDAMLERALRRQPEAELAIALTHAQLQRDRGQDEAALETLQAMHARHPHQPQVLRQLQALYRERRDWEHLLGLVGELRKEKLYPPAELVALQREAWRGLLTDIGRGGEESDPKGRALLLEHAWQRLSTEQRQDPELLALYADQLRVLGAEREAESLLHDLLKRDYDSRLIRLYGLVRGEDPARQLQVAERWLKLYSQDPALLLTLGRLCLQNQLWGKAKGYLESSLAFERHPETCAELARLLAQLGEVERSNRLFQEGLGMLDQRLSGLPLPHVTSGH